MLDMNRICCLWSKKHREQHVPLPDDAQISSPLQPQWQSAAFSILHSAGNSFFLKSEAWQPSKIYLVWQITQQFLAYQNRWCLAFRKPVIALSWLYKTQKEDFKDLASWAKNVSAWLDTLDKVCTSHLYFSLYHWAPTWRQLSILQQFLCLCRGRLQSLLPPPRHMKGGEGWWCAFASNTFTPSGD